MHLAPALEEYIVQLVLATRDPGALRRRSGPRWSATARARARTIALDRCARAHAWLRGAEYVAPEDVQAVAKDVLRHRVLLTFEAEAEGITPDAFIDELLRPRAAGLNMRPLRTLFQPPDAADRMHRRRRCNAGRRGRVTHGRTGRGSAPRRADRSWQRAGVAQHARRRACVRFPRPRHGVRRDARLPGGRRRAQHRLARHRAHRRSTPSCSTRSASARCCCWSTSAPHMRFGTRGAFKSVIAARAAAMIGWARAAPAIASAPCCSTAATASCGRAAASAACCA